VQRLTTALCWAGWAVALSLLLAGCGGPDGVPASARPVVRADEGASATFTIIACPPNDARATLAAELIQVLTQHDELVIARDGGSARLLINACPSGVPVPQAARARP
jgi:hypothetical protein